VKKSDVPPLLLGHLMYVSQVEAEVVVLVVAELVRIREYQKKELL